MSRASFFLTVFTLAFCILSALAAPAQSSASGKGQRTGKASFFHVGLGNCGKTNIDSDWIVALATQTYASGAHCDKKVRITYTGKTAVALVRDSCPSCGANDLDMSPSLFSFFENQDKGVFQMKWNFV